MSISIRKGNGAYEFRLNGVVCSPDEICEHVNNLEQENAKLEDALREIIADIKETAQGTRRNK